ncbi:unnamed protein product, partial [Prorocentrum cordatum]
QACAPWVSKPCSRRAYCSAMPMGQMTFADAMGVASAALSRIQNISTEMVEFCLKVAILVSDLVFIAAAFPAKWEWACDSACRCAQPLRLYAAGCVVICCFDTLLELARCLLEGSLDQLQAQCSNVTSHAVSDQGLLGEGLAPGAAAGAGGPCSRCRTRTRGTTLSRRRAPSRSAWRNSAGSPWR